MPNDTKQAGDRNIAGICQDCSAWTEGKFVRAIDANSGPGVDIVTHGIGICPGPRRRRQEPPQTRGKFRAPRVSDKTSK